MKKRIRSFVLGAGSLLFLSSLACYGDEPAQAPAQAAGQAAENGAANGAGKLGDSPQSLMGTVPSDRGVPLSFPSSQELLAKPVCLQCECFITPPNPNAPAVNIISLMKPGFMMSAFQYVFGRDITSTEDLIEDMIVRLDHAFTVAGANVAKHLVVEVNLSGRNIPGITEGLFGRKVPRVITIENLWMIVEYAVIRMRTAEQRLGLLRQLITLHPDHKEKLDKLVDAEWQAYYEQSWWFGRYFKIYWRLRKHTMAVMKKTNCNADCRATTRYLLQDLGTRDWRVLALRMGEDGQFNAALHEAGVPEDAAKSLFFTDLMRAANEATLANFEKAYPWEDSVRTNAEDMALLAKMTNIAPLDLEERALGDLNSEDLRFVSGKNPIDDDQLEILAHRPGVEMTMATHEKRAQIVNSLRGIFSKPPIGRALVFVAGKSTLGLALKKSALVKWLFKRMRDAELVDNYAYALTRMNRNSKLNAEQILSELRQLSARTPEEDPGGDAVFEFVARRADLLNMWAAIVDEVGLGGTELTDPIKKIKYADIIPILKRLQEQRAAGKLMPLSPIYKISPFENILRFTAYVAAAAVAYQHYYPQIFQWLGW